MRTAAERDRIICAARALVWVTSGQGGFWSDEDLLFAELAEACAVLKDDFNIRAYLDELRAKAGHKE